MAISAFSDQDHPPTYDEVCEILGSHQPHWIQLNEFMLGYYGVPGEWKFSGKNYGWIIWFRKGGKTLASFYPQKEGMVIQLVLGQAHVPQALGLRLTPKIRQLIQETPQLHDGRWLFIPVKTERDRRAVEQLILIKSPPPKRRAPIAHS
ncbi:MAG: DUF3788 family protein [Anaerolineae bacterium]